MPSKGKGKEFRNLISALSIWNFVLSFTKMQTVQPVQTSVAESVE
ncbi:hypothetical protein LEP1GSC199_1292 [Leptospira vanthielii serovar Holland str. Waz Holland = ATCC 700522]|uniref:Uncharacterized protein n=1 Tax=Leptospira vanthielii serovar Holland str. Waz Holland = ATCC 700522 TaxID=1218591 RepID=N1W1Y7_9LEPT|nr:hypothetical protein LEP1GSC199_1292 [Leptospira vanthielii serovar Holland str. Waz Holland = ATCC 700522]